MFKFLFFFSFLLLCENVCILKVGLCKRKEGPILGQFKKVAQLMMRSFQGIAAEQTAFK